MKIGCGGVAETVNNIDKFIVLANDLYLKQNYDKALIYYRKAADLGSKTY